WFREALALRPDLRGVHLALGEIYLGSGDYGSAEREFREETQLAPGFAAAAFKLGIVLMNRGEVRGARAELERANALQPDMPETLVELGKATAAAGETAAAEKLFRRVVELERDSSLAETAHFQLSSFTGNWGVSPTPIVRRSFFKRSERLGSDPDPPLRVTDSADSPWSWKIHSAFSANDNWSLVPLTTRFVRSAAEFHPVTVHG
ncbi:MAG: Tetratricopeptide 2 repeat protein, partial [Bryobacterales bacterium]|nr:Tetratricopeptide 2 repeat protein [Bryobacterales bacterium]